MMSHEPGTFPFPVVLALMQWFGDEERRLEQHDQQIMAAHDQEGTVRITSGREHTMVEILDVLRRLDGPLAESMIAGHE